MAAIAWIGQAVGSVIGNLSGSGLAFFSGNFGTSVNVNEYAGACYISDSTGASQGSQLSYVKYDTATTPTGCYVNGVGPIQAKQVCNFEAPLNIRFTNATAVKCQNSKVRVYDRVSINNNASGVTTKVMDVVNSALTHTLPPPGSGQNWQSINGSSVILTMTLPSPGTSGLAPAGSLSSSIQHDWYLCVSPSPDSVSSKTASLYFYTEYL